MTFPSPVPAPPIVRSLRRALVIPATAATFLLPASLAAQIRVSPTGVSVNAMAATTVFLTFGGVRRGYIAADAEWCGEVISAAPDLGRRCDPRTVYGRLPARYDLSRTSGTGAVTDIMSIPASVARRAYLAAARGEVSSFFYVRRFVSTVAGAAALPDEFVVVTCRLTSGGARVPFALTDVRLRFDADEEVPFVRAGEVLPPFAATIRHNGTGRLVGRWEVVLPGEELPTRDDLLTEGTLPPEARPTQRRYAQLQRFDRFVPPAGEVQLPGPDPARLPTATEGTYLVLLRIEASDDREGDSDLGLLEAGKGIAHAGAVAGFPLPVLRYVVLGDGATRGISSVGATGGDPAALALLAPRDGGIAGRDSSTRLVWRGGRRAAAYRVELQGVSGAPLLSVVLPRAVGWYDLPRVVWERAAAQSLRWRIVALDADGRVRDRSPWRTVRLPPGA